MGLPRMLLCFALALPATGLGAVASAQDGVERDAPPPIALAWRAVEGCPLQADVRARVERLLGEAALDGEAVRAEATVERGAEGLVLTLETGGATRRLRSGACAELADAAALIVAMMADPGAVLAGGAEASAPAPGQAAAEEPGRPTPSAKALASSLDEPSPRPRRVAGDVDRQRGPAETPAETATPEPSPITWYLGAGLDVQVGPLPGVGAGPAVQLGATIGAVRLGAHGRYLPSSRTAVDNHDTAAGEVSLLAAGVSVCVLALEGAVDAGPCAGLEAGVLAAEGRGVSSPGDATAAWVAAGIGGLLSVEVTPWLALRVELEVALPLNRPAFVIDGVEGEAHRPAAVAGRGSLGAEVRFR